MNESIPSSAHPPHAAQNPRIWFGVSGVGRARPEVTCVMKLRKYRLPPMRITIALLLVAAATTLAAQQGSPVAAETLLNRAVLTALDEELSGVAAKDHVGRLTQLHRVPASPGFHDAIESVMQRAKRGGLRAATVEAS